MNPFVITNLIFINWIILVEIIFLYKTNIFSECKKNLARFVSCYLSKVDLGDF